jgi:hypothetical protein
MVSRAHSIVGYKPEGRPVLDFYPTPQEVTEALLSVERFSSKVWECACGDGAISKVLIKHGYNVVSTDIADYGYDGCSNNRLNFIDTPNVLAPQIITNPPFKLFTEFVRHAYYLDIEKFALFGKLAALEGAERSGVLNITGLSRVHIFSKRVSLTRNGSKMKNSGMIAFAWYVWDKSSTNAKPEIDWI